MDQILDAPHHMLGTSGNFVFLKPWQAVGAKK